MKKRHAFLILLIVLVLLAALGLLMFASSVGAQKDTKITVTSNSSLYDGDNFTILLSDDSNVPLANQKVNITIIDSNAVENRQVVTTDANGIGVLQLSGFEPGDYTFKLSFAGNGNLNPCTATSFVKIIEEVVEEVLPYDWNISEDYYDYDSGYDEGYEGDYYDYDYDYDYDYGYDEYQY